MKSHEIPMFFSHRNPHVFFSGHWSYPHSSWWTPHSRNLDPKIQWFINRVTVAIEMWSIQFFSVWLLPSITGFIGFSLGHLVPSHRFLMVPTSCSLFFDVFWGVPTLDVMAILGCPIGNIHPWNQYPETYRIQNEHPETSRMTIKINIGDGHFNHEIRE